MNKKTYEKSYEKITRSLHGYPYRLTIFTMISKISTALVYCIYPIFLFMLALNRDIRFWRVFLTPAISFVLVSAFRNYINIPRPYEILDITPIINKATKGRSFPSRHVFSAFVIATTLYYVSTLVGVVLIFLGVILAVVRVIGGVHFPRDVAAGAIIGILSGIIGFLIESIIIL